MIESLVSACLRQRIVVAVIAVILLAFGLDAARKLSVDAFPDVTNVQVQIATEAAGRSPEEVERFATAPIEVAMTGLPGLFQRPPTSAAPVPSQMAWRLSPIRKICIRRQCRNTASRANLQPAWPPARSWPHPAVCAR